MDIKGGDPCICAEDCRGAVTLRNVSPQKAVAALCALVCCVVQGTQASHDSAMHPGRVEADKFT